MKKRFMLPVILLMILSMFLSLAHAESIDLDNLSLEDLQKLQEQLNQKINEKENQPAQTDGAGTEQQETQIPEPVVTPVPITGLKISVPKEPLASGKETDLKPLVTVMPEGASGDGLVFTVNDENLATVTSDGKMTGKKAGTVTVTVTDPISGKKASARMQIVTLIEEIEVVSRQVEVFVGKSCKLEPKFIPEDATNKKLRWESDNPEIAKVAASGTVTGVALGSTYITGHSQDGSYKVCLYRVTVTRPMKKITLDVREKNYFTDERLTMGYTVEPVDTTNKKIIWTSSDPGIAEVNANGQVYAKSPGKCVITATAADGGGATAKFTAYVDPDSPMHITSMNYKNTRNGRVYSFEVVSDCVRRKIKGFNYEIRCYDEGEDIPSVSTYYFDRRLDPGRKATTNWSGTGTPGFQSAERVVVIITGVFFMDDTSIKIDEDERREITFTFN